jgi:hypothetical protein
MLPLINKFQIYSCKKKTLVFCAITTIFFFHSHNNDLIQSHFFRGPTVIQTVQHLGASVELASQFCTVDMLILFITECDDGKDPDGILLMPSYKETRFLTVILIRPQARPAWCKNRLLQFYFNSYSAYSVQQEGLAEKLNIIQQWSAFSNSHSLYCLLTVKAYESTTFCRPGNDPQQFQRWIRRL